jgi:hypothetical protein
MARGVPDEEVAEPRVMPEDLPRKVVPYMEEPPNLLAGLEGAADATVKKYNADAATWAGDQLSQFRVQATQQLQQAKDNAPAGDPGDFAQNFKAQLDRSAAPLLQQALLQHAEGNPAARMLSKGLQEFSDTLLVENRQWEAEQRTSSRQDSIMSNVQSQAAVVESHPELRQSVGESLMQQVGSMGGNPANRLKFARAVDEQLSLAAANGLTRQDPRGALQALNDPEHAPAKFAPVVSNLDDAKREAIRAKANEHLGDQVYDALAGNNFHAAQTALFRSADLMDPKQIDRLQGSINAAQEHQMVMADKAQHDASDALLKNAIQMSEQGQLTDQWIEKNHRIWTPQAYEYAKALVSGKKVDTDLPTYLGLLDRKSSGEDVREEAMTAASHGLLDKADATKLMEGGGDAPPPLYKRGHDYIQTAGQVSQLEPDPAKTQTLANMQNDWSDLYRQNEGEWAKDPAKGEAAYRQLVARYQLVPAEKNMLTLPVPRYFQGTRLAPDLSGSAAATFKAFQNKEIDQDEFNRQAYLLSQWQHAQEIAQQRKAAAAQQQQAKP